MEYQPRLDEKYKPVLHCISSFDRVLLWKVTRYSYQLFHFLFYISFYISRYFLQLFRTSFNIWKRFHHKFSFFNRFTQTPHHPDDQNLQSITKVFHQFSLKCLLKYFFQKFVDKILQKYILCISSELLLYIYF